MPQNAVATASTASQAFQAGTQAGGQYRFRAVLGGDTTTMLRDTPDATFVSLPVGTYSFNACRLGVDGTTVMGATHTQNGVVITEDVSITVVTGLTVLPVQV